MGRKNKSNVNSGKNLRKSINERKGVGSNSPAKSVSPGAPGSSKQGTRKDK